MNSKQAAEELLQISSVLKKYHELSVLASYDQIATAAPGALNRRLELRKFTNNQYRQLLLSSRTKELVQYLSEPSICDSLNPVMQGEVSEYNRQIKATGNAPEELVSAFSSLASLTEQQWIAARQTGEYDGILENIGTLVQLKKQIAAADLPDKLSKTSHPLDPVIDATDSGMTVAVLDPIFDKIRKTSVPLLEAIRATESPDLANLPRMDTHLQKKLCIALADQMGYSSQYGVIGKGEHPCTYGVNRYDVRFTDHFYPDNFLHAIVSATHEGGHGIYEMSTDPDLTDMLIGGPIAGSIHESSSRFFEILIGHSMPFCEFLAGFLKDFNRKNPGCGLTALEQYTAEDYYNRLNQITFNPRRIHSDELSYNLHILLRYEIEKGLFSDDILPKEIPTVWNDLSLKYLGILPPSDSLGWAQDMHWPAGMFGYFQSYTMGNLYSNQVYSRIRDEITNLDELVRSGNFLPIKEWLTANWYRFGRQYDAITLMEKVTGKPLSADDLCKHLTEKYTPGSEA